MPNKTFSRLALYLLLTLLSRFASAQTTFSSVILNNQTSTLGTIQTPLSIGNLYNATQIPSFKFNTYDDGTSHLDMHSMRWGSWVQFSREDPSGLSYGVMQVYSTPSVGATLSLFNLSNQTTLQLNGSGTSFFTGGAVAIGTMNPGSNKLAVEGTIGARQVVVTTTNPFPDYVFAPGYNLPPLDSLARYINRYHHLPDLPTADSVEKKGLDLGTSQVELVKKVEELTLYIIEQNRKMAAMEERIEQLERRRKASKINAHPTPGRSDSR